jgi:hypothetical protein
MAMWASGQEQEADARQKAKDEADGTKRMQISPAALKRRLKAKRERERAAKKGGASV